MLLSLPGVVAIEKLWPLAFSITSVRPNSASSANSLSAMGFSSALCLSDRSNPVSTFFFAMSPPPRLFGELSMAPIVTPEMTPAPKTEAGQKP